MNELIIDFDHLSLRPGLLAFLREELNAGGLRSGRLTLGNVPSSPEMIYFLWHEPAEEPVSMLFRRDALNEESGLHQITNEFLTKWRRRLD